MTSRTEPLVKQAEGLLHRLDTPSVIVGRRRLLGNLRRVQAIADGAGVALRPHVKTHKSPALARLQIETGAVGVTASKVDEAIVFIAAGIGSVTVAYPLVSGPKIDRLLDAARAHRTGLRCVADSPEGVEALALAASRHGYVLPTFVKVDVGLHRCGVAPNGPDALDLAGRIQASPSLRFAGLLSHAGHAYGKTEPDEVRAVARTEQAILLRLAEALHQAGFPVGEVSVGSTPTVLANDGFAGITEIRPGNYVFMDLTQVGVGVATFEDIALSVLATVVSRNEEYLIVDAGSKVLSSDRGPHGTDRVKGFGLAVPVGKMGSREDAMPVARLSEEHGFIERQGRQIPVGARVRIYPNHACTVVGLADSLTVLDDNEPLETWTIEGRGKVQ